MMTSLVAIATFAVVISSQCLASPAGLDRSTQPSVCTYRAKEMVLLHVVDSQ